MLVVALSAAAAFASFATAPAQAWTVENSGCPGYLEVPKTYGYTGTVFEFPQRFAWRSSCYSNYQQVINVRYRLCSYNLQTRSWGYYTEVWRSATANPGTTGTTMMGLSGMSKWGNISADVLIEWRLTNGYLIGSHDVNYNAVGDYACRTNNTYVCAVYSDPVVGAYLHMA